MTLKFNALVPPFDIAGGTGSIGTPEGWLDLTTIEGVDSSGTTDSTTGLLKGIEEAFAKTKVAYIPSGTYKIGESGTGLDFTKVSFGATTELPNTQKGWVGLTIFCDANVVFEGNAALGTNPVVNIAGVTSKEAGKGSAFINAHITLGIVKRAREAGGACVRVCGWSEGSTLCIGRLEGGTRGLLVRSEEGLWADNSDYRIGSIEVSTIGVLLESEREEGTLEGVQANVFHIDAIQKCSTGINVDGATKKNSRWNEFWVGVIGQCTTSLVNNGANNRYNVTIGTGEGTSGLLNAVCYVRGWFEAGTLTETPVNTCDVWNSKEEPFRPVRTGEFTTSWSALVIPALASKKVENGPRAPEGKSEVLVRNGTGYHAFLKGTFKAIQTYEEDEVGVGAGTGEFILKFTWQGNVYETVKIPVAATGEEVAKKLSEAKSGAKTLPKGGGEPFESGGGTLATAVKIKAAHELYGPLSALSMTGLTGGTPKYVTKVKGIATTNGEEVVKLVTEGGAVEAIGPLAKNYGTLTTELNSAGGAITELKITEASNLIPNGAKVKTKDSVASKEQTWTVTKQVNAGELVIKVESQKPNFNYTTSDPVESVPELFVPMAYGKNESEAALTQVIARITQVPVSLGEPYAAALFLPKSVTLQNNELLVLDCSYPTFT